MAKLEKTYSPEDVNIYFNGVNINSGIAEGTFLTVVRDEDAYFKYTGAGGDVARTRNANKGGQITLTLMQTSEVNRELMRLALADELGAEIVGTISIQDPSDPLGSFMLIAHSAWIMKIPDAEFAKEYGTREWTFDVAFLDIKEEVNDLVE